MGPIRRVATLKSPLHLDSLRADTVLKNAGFVRADMRGSQRLTEFWPELHAKILRQNPALKRPLKKYGPDLLT